MTMVGEDNLDTLAGKERQVNPLGEEVQKGMFQAAGRWFKEHGHLDIQKERMAMWERIRKALPEGKLKEIHGNAKWLAELDAQVAGWSGRGKDAVWILAKDVIATEFPLVMALPNNVPSIFDAWSARASGYIGEQAIKGTVAAVEGAKGVIGTVQNRIDTLGEDVEKRKVAMAARAKETLSTVRGRIDAAMTSILSGSVMRAAPAGGAV